MKRLIFLLLFPCWLSAQTLPDSTLMKLLHVKKVMVLTKATGVPDDTSAQWYFDQYWKTADGKPVPAKNEELNGPRGKLIYQGRAVLPPHCHNDSLGFAFSYDSLGRLIKKKTFSCEKGDKQNWYYYDSSDHLSLIINDPPLPYVPVTREEYVYDENGNLKSIKGWWTDEPYNPVRKKEDNLAFTVEFTYGKNGLVDSVTIKDDFYSFFDGENWMAASPPEGEAGIPAPVTTYQYIYTY